MTILAIIFCIIMCAVGAMFRDGYPALGSTQGARALGGATCMLGALAYAWVAGTPLWHAAALGFAVYVGFYSDSEHAAGQGGISWHNEPYLAISGITSLAPLAAVTWWLHDWQTALIVLSAGLLKTLIWPACWFVNPARFWGFLAPTRVAATLLGAVVGGTLIYLM